MTLGTRAGVKSPLNLTAKPDYLYSANLNLTKGGVVRDLNRKMVNGFGGGPKMPGTGVRSRAAGMLLDIVKKGEISGSNNHRRNLSKTSDRNSKLSGTRSRSPCLNLDGGLNGSGFSYKNVGGTFGRKKSLSEKILLKKKEKNLSGAGEIVSKSTFRFIKKNGLLGSSDQKENQNQGSRYSSRSPLNASRGSNYTKPNLAKATMLAKSPRRDNSSKVAVIEKKKTKFGITDLIKSQKTAKDLKSFTHRTLATNPKFISSLAPSLPSKTPQANTQKALNFFGNRKIPGNVSQIQTDTQILNSPKPKNGPNTAPKKLSSPKNKSSSLPQHPNPPNPQPPQDPPQLNCKIFWEQTLANFFLVEFWLTICSPW